MRRLRRIAFATVALLVMLASLEVPIASASTSAPSLPADGPAPCSAGNPPAPYRGFCATYGGINTFYGSYGLGFPSPLGWGICASNAGSGGAYPSPNYAYALSGAPAGADLANANAVGFAFSQATVGGFWNGAAGLFTADQAAVAAKLLYDAYVWHAPVPAMDPGVMAAYNQLNVWTLAAQGASGPPVLSISLLGGGTTINGSGTVIATLQFPGTGRALPDAGVLLSFTNATVTGSGGSSSAGGTTNGAGTVSVPVTVTGSGPVTVGVSAIAQVGNPAMLFYRPTRYVTSAQIIAALSSPTVTASSAQFSSTGPLPPTGTISVVKSGDDTAYYPIAGAQFEILTGSTVLDTLTTNAAGKAGPSVALPPGTYTVHESVSPPGYSPAPDQRAVVQAGQNTVVSFTGAAGDLITPATLSLRKVDRFSGAPLGGAHLDVRYDPTGSGTYSEDLGVCVTAPDGACAPPGNDGAGLLPGNYEITEVEPPPGYALDPSGVTRTITLAPGEAGVVRFEDAPLVAQPFVKLATGNVDPTTVILAGAVIEVHDLAGAVVTSCTTDVEGRCSTPPVLIGGDRYCWVETVAPPGLLSGAHGCFTATTTGTPIPIDVDDPGTYVEIDAQKVDAADPTVGIPGAVFDLYRMDGGTGPTHPTPPTDATDLAGGTWVARATGGAGGVATFPLQLPGYRFCVIEHQAPAGYVIEPSPHCTEVIDGVSTEPPTTVTVTVADPELMTSLEVEKQNASDPGQGVPSATYDLYVQGPPPPSTPSPPPDAASFAGMRWYARGTTDQSGRLRFDIPVGHSWCILEHSSPPGYVLDPALRCTGVLDQASAPSARTIAVLEQVEGVVIDAYKFNAADPGVAVPGATYALYIEGALPSGFIGPLVPPGVTVPSGMALFAIGTTDDTGHLAFEVPGGYAWCLQEIASPAGYRLDPGLHCTAVLHGSEPAMSIAVSLPELAFTGATLPVVPGVLALGVGVLLVMLGRRRRASRP